MMTATTAATCYVSGLTIRPGDPIANTPQGIRLLNSIIAIRRPVLNGKPCRACNAPSEPRDRYCADCGACIAQGDERDIHQGRDEARARRDETRARRTYTIATDDPAPVVIAQVTHVDAPEPVAVIEDAAAPVMALAKPLAQAIKTAAGVIESKSPWPVILTAAADTLTVTARTADAYVSRRISGYAGPGRVAAWQVALSLTDARNLAAMLTNDKGTATLTPAGKSLTVKTGDDTQTINAETGDDWNAAAPETPHELVTIDAAILARHINTVAPAVAKGPNARPSLSGVAFDTQEPTLVLVAADGFQLIQADTSHVATQAPTMPVTVKPLAKFATAFSKAKHEEARVTYGAGWLTISTERDTWSAAVIDATFPDWRKIAKAQQDAPAVTCNTAALTAATKAAALFSHCITYTWDATEGAIIITARDAERGDVTRYVSATGSGIDHGTRSALDAGYVLKALRNAGSTSTLALTGELTAAVLNDSLIMPIAIEHKHAA